TQNDLTEFNYTFPKSSVFLFGNQPKNENEICLSDYILEKFGIKDDLQKIVGKKISFYCEGESLIEDYTVSGIINSEFFRISSMNHMPQIFLRGSEQINNTYNIDTIATRLDIDNYRNTLNVLDLLYEKNYHAYLGADIIASYYNVISGAQAIVSRLVGLFGGMICIAIILNLYNVLLTAAEEKKNCYGILKAIGMPGKSLYAIAYIEIFILTFIAVTAAGLISWWLLQLANQIMFSYIQIRLSISIEKYAVISLLTLLGISGLIFLIELPILKKMFSSQPAKLLR
ncbi:MAG: ABC transporter permease, partial [Oscillospiraceae bacterium]